MGQPRRILWALGSDHGRHLQTMASCCVAQLSLGEAGLAWSSALIASAVCKGGRGEVCYVSDDTNVSIASICSWELLVSSVS